MPINKLLVANRGEIAIRIIRAARELGIASVAIHSADDATSLHVRRADEAYALEAVGSRAYLDIDAVIQAAQATGCDALHPGYGFLAESPELARRCGAAGISFVGPSVESLELFGDKAAARNLAVELEVPVLLGSHGAVTLAEAQAFFASLGDNESMVIKAIAGGGGRGMRVVSAADEIEEGYARCQSEAAAAFGDGALLVERLSPRARHIEVQIIGDGQGQVSHLGERECSLQRRHQKVVEWAPSPTLGAATRDRLTAAAVRMAAAMTYRSLGTFEFLVDSADERDFAFIEANPRLQVEHTVTEEVTGVDLVRAQLRIAAGERLAEIGLAQSDVPAARGYAIQTRVNMERMQPDGEVRPSGGMLTAFEPPSGPGVRIDTYGYPGYTTNPNFDSLLAKVIAYSASADFGDVVGRARGALSEFRIDGVETNLTFLDRALAHEDFASGAIHTRWVDAHVAELAAPDGRRIGAAERSAGRGGRSGRSAARHAGSARRAQLLPRGLGHAFGVRGRCGAGSTTRAGDCWAAEHRAGSLAAAGHDHPDRGRRGGRGPRWPADVRDGLDEDGARDQVGCRGVPPRADRRDRRRGLRGPRTGLHRAGRCGRRDRGA